MSAADYPVLVHVGRGADRLTVRMRPDGLLVKFADIEDAHIEELVRRDFDGPAVGAGPRALASRPRQVVAAGPAPRPVEIVNERLRARSMRLVPIRPGPDSRYTIRQFLRRNAQNVTLAAPIYQPAPDPDLVGAVAPMTSMFVVRLQEAGDALVIRRIRQLGTTHDEYFSMPDGAGSLERFRIDEAVTDPVTRERRIPDDGFELLARIRALPGVDFAEHDWVAVDPFEAVPAPAPARWNIPAFQAVAAAADGQRAVVIAVIDTGFDRAHPALAGAWTGPGASFPAPSGTPEDEPADPPAVVPGAGAEDDVLWHGTAVAGILAGQRVAHDGIDGIAQGCHLLPLRVTRFSDSNIASALRYAVEQGAHVVNISLRCGTPHSSLQTAVREAWQKKVVVCAAAGNSAPDEPPRVVYPAAFPEVISVGASVPGGSPKTLGDGQVVGDPGDDWYSGYGPVLDVLAPGVEIRTTDVSAATRMAMGGAPAAAGDYTRFDGTSAAAPHVSGLAALLLRELNFIEWEGDRNELVRELIERSCAKVGGEELYPFGTPDKPRSLEHGYGFIDPVEAFEELARSRQRP